MLTRYFRWTAYAVGGLLALLAMALAVLHTTPAKQFALRQAVRILREQGIDFQASRLDYNLFTRRLELSGVRVQSPAAPDLPPLALADRVAARFNVRRLLAGAIYIQDAVIENPRVHLVIDTDGRDNIPRLPAGNPQSQPVDYLVSQLRMTGGEVRIEERRQRIAAFFPLGKLSVDGDPATHNHRIGLATLDGGAVILAGRSSPVSPISADILLEKSAVNVRAFTARATVGLASMAGYFGVPLAASGDVTVAVSASGPISRLSATVRVQGGNLVLEQFDRVSLDANAAYDMGSSRVRLESLDVTSPWGRVRGRAGLEMGVPSRESTAQLNAEGVDMTRVSSAMRLPLRIASTASASLEARWPGLQIREAAGEAVVKLSPQKQAAAKGLLPVDGVMRATSRGNRIALTIEDLRGLRAAVSGDLALVDLKSVAGDLRLEAPRLAATLSAAEAYLGRRAGSLIGTPLDGSLNAEVKVTGTLSAPAASLNVAIPNLSAGKLTGIAVDAAGDYTPERVSIDEASVSWQNQTLRGAGTVGLLGRRPLRLTVRSGGLSLAAILAGLKRGDLPVSGDVTLAAEVTGTADAPEASVKLSATGLAAYQEALGTLQAEAMLAGRQIEVSRLLLDKPQPTGNGSLIASGTYELDSMQYRLQLQGRNLSLLTLTLPDGTPVRGLLGMNAAGQGAVDNPAGDLKLTAEGIQVSGQDFGSAAVSLTAANRQVTFEATAPKYKLSAKGLVGTQGANPASVQVRLEQTDLAQLPLKLGQPLEGTVSAVIDAAGDLENWQQGTARVEVSELEARWNGEPVRTDGPLTGRYTNGVVVLERAALVAAGSRVEANGNLPLDRAGAEGAIRLSAQLNLPGLARFAPADLNLDLQGAAIVDGTIRGTLRRIDPTVAIALDNASIAARGLSPAVTNATVRGQVRDGAFEIGNASAKWGNAAFEASGVVPFGLLPEDLPFDLPRRQGPARFTAEVKGVTLEAIGSLPAGLSGNLSARLEAESSAPELSAVKAKLTFPELHAKLENYSIEQNGTSEIVLENGVARVRHLELAGPSTEIRLAGTAEIMGRQALDLRLDCKLDASLASAFSRTVRARGATEIHAAVTGSAQQPEAKGYLQIADGQVSIEEPRLSVEGLNLRVDLDGTRATVSKLEGQVNGGALGGQGSVVFAGGNLRDSDLTVRAEDLYLDFPAGLKTVSDLRLQLKNVGDRLALRGSVLVKEGGFTDDLNFDKGILAAATAPRTPELGQERNQLLESVQLNVSVTTQDPIVVQNNLAKAEITAQMVVLGNPYEPGLAGRLIIEEGSELTLQERRYEVSRGIITFTSDRRIEPNLDIEATTQASTYDITLRISGPPGETKTELTSNPVLPEPDILALLVTGKTLDKIEGQELQVAQTQMLSYLTGRVGSTVGRQLERATGLSHVRVEPNLIAAETTPSARLTVGQDINRNLHLVYSMDLVDSSDQIYVAEYDLTKRFVTRGVRQSDGSFRFDFRHDWRFGGLTPPQRGARNDARHIGNIAITGPNYFPDEKVLSKLKVKTGDRYDFFKLRRGLDRVARMYTDAGLLESSVRLMRDQKDSTVNLNLRLNPGPKLRFVYEGASVPGAVAKKVRGTWSSGVFDTQRTEDSAGVLRAWLIGQRYLKTEVKTGIATPQPDVKRVLFEIQRGPRFADVEWVFEGAAGISAKTLRGVIESQKLSTDVYTKPSRVTELLTQFYREEAYLDAEVSEPRYELDGDTTRGKVIFPVKEGPLYRVGEARFEGNRALATTEIAEVVPLPAGAEYRPALRDNALQRLREVYWERGYNNVEIDAEVQRIAERALVNLAFRITENARGVVREVIIEGNRSTSEHLIRSQLELRPGDPVNLQKVSGSRRKLYNTGAFAMVEITPEDLVTTDAAASSADHPVRLHVRVQEVQPFQVRYGGLYDTEHGAGGIVDFSNRNTLGSARVLGFRGRYDSQLHEARAYFSQPLLTRFPLKTLVSGFVRREVNPETELASGFNVDRLGFAAQQDAEFRGKWLLNYGYRIEKSHTYDTGPDPFFDVTLRLAFLTSTISRDTRDELLDASRGSFLSHAIQVSPESLGSQVRFVKYFGQYFRYFPLQKPKVELFTNQVLRPRLIFATAVRVGLEWGLGGQEVPLSERFFAGGGTTIRGFEQNSVGTGKTIGSQLGGTGMLVLNNELRFPLFRIFDGVAFVDVGNVYPKVSDFTLSDLRKAAGPGLRVRTPWFLLRLDYGFKLDRRPGESVGRLFFSIGQAF